MCENDKEGEKQWVRDFAYIFMHGFGLPTPHADPHNNCLWHYSAHNDYHRGPLYWCRKCKQMVASHSTSKR